MYNLESLLEVICSRVNGRPESVYLHYIVMMPLVHHNAQQQISKGTRTSQYEIHFLILDH